MVSRPVKCPCLHCCDLCDNASMWTVLRPLFTRAPSWFLSLARRPSIPFALIQEHLLGNHVVYQALAPTQPIASRQASDLLCADVAHQLAVDVLAGMVPSEAAFFPERVSISRSRRSTRTRFCPVSSPRNHGERALEPPPVSAPCPRTGRRSSSRFPPRCPGSPCRTAHRSSALCFRWPCCLLSGKRRTSPARRTRCG